jgi:hypothetical protein
MRRILLFLAALLVSSAALAGPPPIPPSVTVRITGPFTFANVTSSKNFTVQSGNNSVTYPVMTLNPVATASQMAFDLFPSAGAVDGGNGYTWSDYCDAISVTTCARVGETSVGTIFGNNSFNGATPEPTFITSNSINGIEVFTDGTGELFQNVGIKVAPAAGTALTVGGYTHLNGILISTGTAPGTSGGSGCGSSPTVSGTATNVHGTITPGSGATTCTITFVTAAGVTYGTTPDCTLTGWASTTVPYITSVSTAALVVGFGVVGKFTYHCIQ